nr:type II toxin-antitoxin system RelE/ParE family toxin [Variovorax boronicumulans]
MRESPTAASKAAIVIKASLSALERMPGIGRPYEEDPGPFEHRAEFLRELVIGFGKSGYLALYLDEPGAPLIPILAFRHQREAGYPWSVP